MCFPETVKKKVKKKADYTCCWCNDRQHKVEVHHIIPREEKGPDTEENAAPLCGSCHNEYGDNPKLRKEIRERRDHWYDTCQKKLEFAWSPNLLIPSLDTFEFTEPLEEKTKRGTNVREDWPRFKFLSHHDANGTSPLQISIGYYPEVSGSNKFPRLLSIRVEVPFGLLFNLGVCAENNWDVSGLMDTLRNKKDIWLMKGHPDKNNPTDPVYQLRDYFMLLRMNNGENRLIMKTYLPTEAGITFRAKLSDDVLISFSNYLEEKGFTKYEAS